MSHLRQESDMAQNRQLLHIMMPSDGKAYVRLIPYQYHPGWRPHLGYVGMVVYAYCTVPPTNTSWHIAARDLMMSRCSHKLSPCIHVRNMIYASPLHTAPPVQVLLVHSLSSRATGSTGTCTSAIQGLQDLQTFRRSHLCHRQRPGC